MASQPMIYSFIVARSRDHAIGCENALPWRLPSDLRRFKQLTLGKPIIMGRRTYDSIGHPLPGRPNIVISREKGEDRAGLTFVSSKEEAMRLAETEARRLGVREVMVVGGAEIFELFDQDASRVYLTEVETQVSKGDAYYTRNFSDWIVKHRESVSNRPNDEFDYVLTIFERPALERSLAQRELSSRQPCYA